MYLVGDYIHPTPHQGRCRIRIYRPDLPVEGSAARDEAVVICTGFHRLPTPLVWIEHHEDPHTFDLVTFESYEVEHLGEERKRIGEASRKPLDRATGEALVGSPVL
jgi:hypothetical protein